MFQIKTETYLTQKELSARLGVTVRTLLGWRLQRIGPPVTYLGRKPVYREAAVEEWLRSRERESVGESPEGRAAA